MDHSGPLIHDPKRQPKTSVFCTLYRFYRDAPSCRLADKSQSCGRLFFLHNAQKTQASLKTIYIFYALQLIDLSGALQKLPNLADVSSLWGQLSFNAPAAPLNLTSALTAARKVGAQRLMSADNFTTVYEYLARVSPDVKENKCSQFRVRYEV